MYFWSRAPDYIVCIEFLKLLSTLSEECGSILGEPGARLFCVNSMYSLWLRCRSIGDVCCSYRVASCWAMLAASSEGSICSSLLMDLEAFVDLDFFG